MKKLAPPNELFLVSHAFYILPPRQRDCAYLLFEGASSKEIAQILQLSPRTVEAHIDSLRKKFQARNRVHLAGILGKMMVSS